MRAMADAIVECAELVQRGDAAAARSSAATRRALNEICRADHRASKARPTTSHDRGLRQLYQQREGAATPWPSSRGNEIYDHLEKVVDRFDDVANEIHGIVIEHV